MAARLPHEVERIVGEVAERDPRRAVSASTAHNDTENAVANSLAAVRAGARQVQGTLNGLGERCGNANLVALIPTLDAQDGLRDRRHAERAGAAHPCLAPARRAAQPRAQPRTPPMSATAAFAHKGGLHVSAVEKDPRSYEHIDPALVGNRRHIVVSDQAGRANILARLREIGLEVEPTTRSSRTLLERGQGARVRGLCL